jgi:hypothetical protein
LPQTFISAQDSKAGTGAEQEDLLPSPQGKPKPKPALGPSCFGLTWLVAWPALGPSCFGLTWLVAWPALGPSCFALTWLVAWPALGPSCFALWLAKADNEPRKVNEKLRPENVRLRVEKDSEGQLRISMPATIGLGKCCDGPHSQGSRR